MMHPQLQLSQPGLMQGGAAGMANPDVFRRIMQAHLSAKDGSHSQVSNSISNIIVHVRHFFSFEITTAHNLLLASSWHSLRYHEATLIAPKDHALTASYSPILKE
jgi:hypothetical protein